MKKTKLLILIIVIIVIIISVFYFFAGKDKFSEITGINFLNPETKNCLDAGGILENKKRGDGTEYSVCIFEDNRQCETLSLLNNECPKEGVKITGYITEAATYCAVLGGKYEITGNTDDVEDGNCSFFSGKICNVWDLYSGKCEKGVINPIIYINDEFNFSLNLPRSWENKYEIKKEEGENGIKYVAFNYGEGNLFKISIVPFSFWEKEKNHEGEYLNRDNADIFALVYSKDPLRSDKQWGEEYLSMISRIKDIKETFKIVKPYVFLEEKKEEGVNYAIEIMYPYVGAVENGKVNIEISNFVEEIVSKFKETVEKPDAWQGDNILKVFYDPFEINSDFVSIRFESSEDFGGASPGITSYGFNYDLKKNKRILLSDLFDFSKNYINAISERSIQYLLKVNKDSQLSNEDWIREGAGPKEENFAVFTFNKETIVFHFNEYLVAPYAAGRQEVIFPFSSLRDILRNDAVSGYNLKI